MNAHYPPNVQPGSVIQNQKRLRRVDAKDDDVITATSLDGSVDDRHEFYTSIENISEGSLDSPNPDRIENSEPVKRSHPEIKTDLTTAIEQLDDTPKHHAKHRRDAIIVQREQMRKRVEMSGSLSGIDSITVPCTDLLTVTRYYLGT